jgi:hypothetical protein
MANAPTKKIKYGGVSVVVFENEGKNQSTGETFVSTSATLSKSYQDKNQKWVNVNFSFRNSTEVLNAIQCLQEYLSWKYQKNESAAF